MPLATPVEETKLSEDSTEQQKPLPGPPKQKKPLKNASSMSMQKSSKSKEQVEVKSPPSAEPQKED